MSRGIRTQLTMVILLIVLVMTALMSLLANIIINMEFEKYAKEQRKTRSEDIVANLSYQYSSLDGQWDASYVYGMGMYALYEGYVIRLYDKDGEVVWDAENHDMSLCGEIMAEITQRMEKVRPNLNGEFTAQEYPLIENGQNIGKVVINSYGPFFLNENDSDFLNAMNLAFVIIGSFSLVLSLIIGGILARRISRPIMKTAQIATQISEGNYGIRFEGKARVRELDELIAAMNHMAETLDNQEDLRKRLTADIAHELRTPLSAVSSHLEMMMEGMWEPTNEILQGCYEEIERLTGLVVDLERLAEVESENLKLKKTPSDLLSLARTVKANFESESAKKNISLAVQGESSIAPVDRDRMIQVLTNLLSNALKYTEEKGHIQITVKDGPVNGILTVEDDGIGIPADELPHVFERFYRTDKSRNRQTGGAGIGLAIVKSIVAAHGGEVEAESRVNHGSRFTVILPKNS